MIMKKTMKTLFALLGGVCGTALCTVTAFAEEAASAGSADANATANATMQLLTSVIPFAIALVLLYFILLRPQQKREKQAQQMRENVRVGDEICTAGGLVGIVIRVTDDTVVLETGGERSKIRVKKWAIHENITQMEEAAAAEKERKAARRAGIVPAAADDDKKSKDSE